jgi:hypothetical protein
MNTDNQTILHIKAGHLAPAEMLTFILNKKPNVTGFMVQDEGGGIQMGREDATNLDFATVDKLQNDAKECNKTLFFGKFHDGYNVEDIQPFVLANGADDFMGIMIEGDIVGHDSDKSHTEHYNFVHGVLIPKIAEICEDFEGDTAKIIAKLGKPDFKSSFLMHVGHRAVLHVMPLTGEPVLVDKNDLKMEFDWGWVSQAIDYGKKIEAPVAQTPKKVYGFGAKKTEASSPAISMDDKGVHHINPNASKPTMTAKTSVPAAPKTELPTAKYTPPTWLFKNDDVRFFYEHLLGEVPKNAIKKKFGIVPKQNHELLKIDNYEDFKNYRLTQAMKPTGATATKQERVAAAMSSTATPAPADTPPLPAQPTNPTELPILNPKELEQTLDFVAKYLDKNSKEMIPPQEVQKIEKEIEKFSSQVGLKLEETMNWPVSQLFALAGTNAKALVLHLLEWRAYARPFMQAELKAKAKDNVPMTTETTTTQLTPGTTKTESVVKKAVFGFGKKKVA